MQRPETSSIMRRVSFFVCVLASVFSAIGCNGSAPPPKDPTKVQLQVISEADAIQIISDTLKQAGIQAKSGWNVDISAEEPLHVDVRLNDTEFGIEWVSAQDRLDYGNAIPEPDPNGQLRILSGANHDAQAQVLVLDFRTYRYDPDPEHDRNGATSALDAESRLKRDVKDFIEYVRGQGAI